MLHLQRPAIRVYRSTMYALIERVPTKADEACDALSGLRNSVIKPSPAVIFFRPRHPSCGRRRRGPQPKPSVKGRAVLLGRLPMCERF